MPFMLKIQWDLKEGREADFKANQEKLCEVMLEHPGVICYHADYPSEGVSRWVEIYATDEAFAAHLANEKGKGLIGPCYGELTSFGSALITDHPERIFGRNEAPK